MDDTQLRRLYDQETRHHDNPPSFETWMVQRELREQEAKLAARGSVESMRQLFKNWKS
jgi:hypothetical protein